MFLLLACVIIFTELLTYWTFLQIYPLYRQGFVPDPLPGNLVLGLDPTGDWGLCIRFHLVSCASDA